MKKEVLENLREKLPDQEERDRIKTQSIAGKKVFLEADYEDFDLKVKHESWCRKTKKLKEKSFLVNDTNLDDLIRFLQGYRARKLHTIHKPKAELEIVKKIMGKNEN